VACGGEHLLHPLFSRDDNGETVGIHAERSVETAFDILCLTVELLSLFKSALEEDSGPLGLSFSTFLFSGRGRFGQSVEKGLQDFVSFLNASRRLAVRLDRAKMRNTIQLQIVLDFPSLFVIVKEDCWDA